MASTLTLPGLEPTPGRRARRPSPATGDRPEPLSRLLGERSAVLAPPADAPTTAPPAVSAVRPEPGVSLDDVLVGAWDGLVSGTSTCVVCAGVLVASHGAGTRPVGGRCETCGSTLS